MGIADHYRSRAFQSRRLPPFLRHGRRLL